LVLGPHATAFAIGSYVGFSLDGAREAAEQRSALREQVVTFDRSIPVKVKWFLHAMNKGH